MYRNFAMGMIALALIGLPAKTSLAAGPGGRTGTSVGHVVSGASVQVKPGGMATPAVKKLSPKAGAACFRNCMHGLSGAGWGNFCDAACYGH
jgi:hypothetical protein